MFLSNFKPAFLETHSNDSRWLSPRLIICVLCLWLSPLVCQRARSIKPNFCSQRAHELYFLGYYPLLSSFYVLKNQNNSHQKSEKERKNAKMLFVSLQVHGEVVQHRKVSARGDQRELFIACQRIDNSAPEESKHSYCI